MAENKIAKQPRWSAGKVTDYISAHIVSVWVESTTTKRTVPSRRTSISRHVSTLQRDNSANMAAIDRIKEALESLSLQDRPNITKIAKKYRVERIRLSKR